MKQISSEFHGFLNDMGANLAEWRRQTGASQFELARLVGCHPNTLSLIERGKLDPGLTVFSRICLLFGCTELCLKGTGFSFERVEGLGLDPSFKLADYSFALMLRQVGHVVQGRRKTAGLSLRGLAAQAGLHSNTLWNLELGLTEPSISTLHRIYQALSVQAIRVNEGQLSLV